jgi:predicted DCC family thiol-disulfide oxidoreductase YuxK
VRESQDYPIVVFDGTCGFCKNVLNFLKSKYDFSGVTFLPYSDETAVLWKFPEEIVEQHKNYMFFVVNSTEFHRGYFAFQQLFAANEDLKKISNLMRFRIIKLVGKAVYMVISRNRRKLSGRNASCGI